MLLAVATARAAAWALHLPVETIGSRFGGIPRGLPTPSLPALELTQMIDVLPAAISFTLLGAVESLLSAKVADSMTAPRCLVPQSLGLRLQDPVEMIDRIARGDAAVDGE